jgi:hypothetical protein
MVVMRIYEDTNGQRNYINTACKTATVGTYEDLMLQAPAPEMTRPPRWPTHDSCSLSRDTFAGRRRCLQNCLRRNYNFMQANFLIFTYN